MRVQVATIAALVASSSVSTASTDGQALRLAVNGSKILDPTGSEIHLTGMNFVPSHWHEVSGWEVSGQLPKMLPASYRAFPTPTHCPVFPVRVSTIKHTHL